MSYIRNKIFEWIENDVNNVQIIKTLDTIGTNLEIFEDLKMDNESLIEDKVLCDNEEKPFDEWLISSINMLRNDVEANNKIFKNISKHDIIRSRDYTLNDNVKLSNELFHIKKDFEQLENDKRDLQIKLEKVRNCETRANFKCYECKDNICINNIWYKG